MTAEDLMKLLPAPVQEVVAVAALTIVGAGLLLTAMGKRDDKIRKELRKEFDEELSSLTKRIEALERGNVEARAITLEIASEAARLGPTADRISNLVTRLAAVLR